MHLSMWTYPWDIQDQGLEALAADLAGRAGLNTVFEGDHLRVVYVAPGSPAEAAGWKAGEQVTAIDGKPIGAGYNGSDQSLWLYGAAGKAVTLKTADGAVRKLVLKDYF